MKLRYFPAIIALVLFAPAAYTADDCYAAQPKNPEVPAVRPAPKDSCAKPCPIYRISTRCECALRNAVPASV